MTSGQIINKRNGFALSLIIAVLLISMIGIAVGSIAKGAERNLEKVTYPTSFKLSQSDTAYSFSELTYILQDKDKQHYYVMEPEYYYYHWAEIKMTIDYPEREDPLVYWNEETDEDVVNKCVYLYEDSELTKKMDIRGSEFASLSYNFDANRSNLNFELGNVLDLLDEHGDSQTYYIMIEPYTTATTEHDGTAIVIEFNYKDTEYTTTRKSHSTTTTTTQSSSGWTVTKRPDWDARDPVSEGIHVHQPSKYRYSTTTTTKKKYPDGINKNEDGMWGYYKNGVVDTSFNGFASNEFGTWYIKDGYIGWSETGVYSGEDGQYYVIDGKVNTEKNGDVTIDGVVYTLKDGKVVSSHSIPDEPTSQKVEEPSSQKEEEPTSKKTEEPSSQKADEPTSKKAEEPTSKKIEEPTTKKNDPTKPSAKPATTLNGLVQGPDGKWAMYKNGVVDTSATGVFQNVHGWWRVEKGYVNFHAQGIYQNAYGWWKTTNGKVTFKEEGVFQNEHGWWRVKDSKVDFNAQGIYQNKNGWWKTKNGKVDFSFTGIAKNEHGTWYVKTGKVDFSKNGKVTYNGKTYTVVNGKVK